MRIVCRALFLIADSSLVDLPMITSIFLASSFDSRGVAPLAPTTLIVQENIAGRKLLQSLT